MRFSRHVLPALLLASLALNVGQALRSGADSEVPRVGIKNHAGMASPLPSTGHATPALAKAPSLEGAALIERALPQSAEDKQAYLDRLSEPISTSRTASERMLVVTHILSGMTPENAQLIKTAFNQSWESGCHFHAEHDLMWSRLGEVLKAEAVNQFIKSDGPFWPVHGKLLEGWARSDPEGALQWLKSAETGPHRSQILTSTLRGLASTDPDRSLQFVLSLPPAEQTQALIAAESGAGNLGGAPGSDRLRDAMAGLSQTEFRHVFTVAAKGNPLQAVGWADAFALRHPSRSSEAYDTIAASWSSVDPVAMSKWLNKGQNHPGGDAMILRLVGQIAAEDPEAAQAWAGKIKEESFRQQAWEKIKNRAP
jgi:hypothetical protein